jgi:hypothetical protein
LHTSQICCDFFEVWLIRRELKLDEETRWQITGEVEGVRQHGEWEWLDEEARRCVGWHLARALTTSARL